VEIYSLEEFSKDSQESKDFYTLHFYLSHLFQIYFLGFLERMKSSIFNFDYRSKLRKKKASFLFENPKALD